MDQIAVETAGDHWHKFVTKNSSEWPIVLVPADNYTYKEFGAFRDMV
jgi:hypothetical protein